MMAHKVIDFWHKLQRVNDANQAWELLCRSLNDFGIQHVFYGQFADSRLDQYPLGKFRCNYDSEFTEAYNALDLRNDATFLWSQQMDYALEWSRVNENSIPDSIKLVETLIPSAEHQRMEELSADFHYIHGLSIPIKRAGGCFNAFGLSATDSHRKEYIVDIQPQLQPVQEICQLFDQYVSQHFKSSLNAGFERYNLPALDTWEHETLRWLMAGFSIKQIADEKLYKSVDSINQYIRSAKAKLQATTRDQLIARAIILGLVDS